MSTWAAIIQNRDLRDTAGPMPPVFTGGISSAQVRLCVRNRRATTTIAQAGAHHTEAR
jgi:hypothetical protein